jgi:hypothetical protein
MNKLLLIFIVSCNAVFAQGNLIFSEPMHFTSNVSLQPSQTRVSCDTITIPTGYILKLESHYTAASQYVNSANPSVLSIDYPTSIVIEATRTIPGKGIILGSTSNSSNPENGNFPMWLSNGTYYIYIHKTSTALPFYGRYSLHGILFSIN